MSNFFKLIYNEMTKIYMRKSTWIMYLILAVLIIGFGLLNKVFDDVADARTYGEDWRQELQAENDKILEEQAKVDEKLADYDEKYADENQDEDGWDEERFDIEITAPDMGVVDNNNLYLDDDIKPSGYGAWQFVADNAGMLSVVSLMTIIIAAGIVAHEFRWGTIKVLLIRPISRTKILFSKYTAVLLFASITLLFVLLFAWGYGAVLFGIEGSNPQMILYDYSDFDTIDVVGSLVSTYQQVKSGYGYGLVNLVMMTTLAFMISAVFRNSSLAIGTAVFLLFAGTTATMILMAFDMKITKYILFANTDLKQYADGHVFMEGMTLGFSVTVLAVYYVIFMALSWIFFVKRDVA